MTSVKYIGLDVHKESISICVRNSVGKVMECVIETKASTILQFIDGLRGDLHVTFEEGTWAVWLYDLLKPRVTRVVVGNPRKSALLKDGSKSDRIDANKLSEQLYMNNIKSVYHGGRGLRTLKELARSYLTVTKDLTRVMNRVPGELLRSLGTVARFSAMSHCYTEQTNNSPTTGWLNEKWLLFRAKRTLKKRHAFTAESDRKHGAPPGASAD